MTNSEILGGRLLPLQDLPLYRLVEETCWRAAVYYRLSLELVEPLRHHQDSPVWGWCDTDSNRVSIGVRFSKHGKWNARPIRPRRLLETICHELAHIRYPKEDRKHRNLLNKIFENLMFEGFLEEFQKLRKWLPPEERYQ